MRRVLFLVILALTVLVVAPSAMAENGPKFTESAISSMSFGR
ncbi:MAG: hypothetical protein ACOY94_03825 [Bacillota bacterium]